MIVEVREHDLTEAIGSGLIECRQARRQAGNRVSPLCIKSPARAAGKLTRTLNLGGIGFGATPPVAPNQACRLHSILPRLFIYFAFLYFQPPFGRSGVWGAAGCSLLVPKPRGFGTTN